MAFEQAKQNFETKTKEAPKTVEGDWKSFKAVAEGYLANKQKEVSSFIGKLEYEGKDQDKNNYLASMNKAVDDLIDGNEATKKEMAEYNRLLLGKSNEFKNKLLVERAAMEVRETKSKLMPTVSYFEGNGLPINISDNVKTYLSLPQDKRIPLEKINSSMEAIFKDARAFMPRNEITNNKNTFYTIFNHLSWGNTDGAKKETQNLNDYMDFFKQCENVRQKTGLKISNEELNGMMSVLVKTGVDKKKAGEFIVKNTEKLKKMDEKSFNELTQNLDKKSLSRFLLTAVVSVNEGKTADALGGIKMTMIIESTTLKSQREIMGRVQKVEGYLKQEVADLQKYQEKNPKVAMDEKVAGFQKEIAESIYSLESGKKDIVLNDAKKSLANAYLGMKGAKPSGKDAENTINAILNAKDSQELERLAVDKCGFAKIPQLDILRSAELKVGMAKQEFDVKEWYAKNPNIDGDIKLHAVLENFYKTGELTPNGKSVFKEQLEYQGKALKGLINDNLENEKDGALYLTEIRGKPALDISHIPPENLEAVSGRLTGYMSLLKTLHTANAKYVGNQESLLLLYPGNKEIQNEIKSARERGEYLAKKFKDVAKFMGISKPFDLYEEDTKLETDKLVESPLFGPLIQKETSPYVRKMGSHMDNVWGNSWFLKNFEKRFQKKIAAQAEQNSRMVTYRFNEEIGFSIKLAGSIEAARNEAINIRKRIEQSINDPSIIKGMPKSMVLQREKYLRNMLKNFDDAINNPKSPISLAQIESIHKFTDGLKEARDKYIREGFWKGIAMAAIMAAGIFAAVGGGMAAGALGAKLFGTAASGSFVSGSISVGAGVSKFAVGTMAMTGVAGGSVIGSRAVMNGLDMAGLVDFGGAEKIWNPTDMADDFSLSFATSLLAVGTAKTAIGALQKISTSQYAKFRFPGLVNFSQNALGKMEIVSKLASPSGWFQSGKANSRTLAQHLRTQTTIEAGEEGVENAAGKIHPALEFLASVANSADGVNVNLSMHGIKAARVGLTIEGNKMVYKTATPQEFIANLNSELEASPNMRYETKVNPDGSVTVFLMKMGVDPKTGQQINKTFSEVNIAPAQDSKNLTPEAEIARIPGLKTIPSGQLVVMNDSEYPSVLKSLKDKGFMMSENEKGNLNVSKGATKFELRVPPQQMKFMEVLAAGKTALVAEKEVTEPKTNLDKLVAAFDPKSGYRGNPTEILLKLSPNEIEATLKFPGMRERILTSLHVDENNLSKIKKVCDKFKSSDPKFENDYLELQRKKLIELSNHDINGRFWIRLTELQNVFKTFKNPTEKTISKEDAPSVLRELLSYPHSIEIISVVNKNLLSIGVSHEEVIIIAKTELSKILKQSGDFLAAEDYHSLNPKVEAVLNFVNASGMSEMSKFEFFVQLHEAAIKFKEQGNPILAGIISDRLSFPNLKGELSIDPFENQNPDIQKTIFMGKALTAFEQISIKDRAELSPDQIQQKMLALMDRKTALGLTLKQRKLINDVIVKYKNEHAEFLKLKKLSKPEQKAWLRQFLQNELGEESKIRDFDFEIKFAETRENGPQVTISVPAEIIAQMNSGIKDMSKLSEDSSKFIVQKSNWIGGLNFGGFVSLTLEGNSKEHKTDLHEATHYFTSFLGITPRYASLKAGPNAPIFEQIKVGYRKQLQRIGNEIISYTKDGSLKKYGPDALFVTFEQRYFKDVYDASHLTEEDQTIVNNFKEKAKKDFEVAVIAAIKNAYEISKRPNGFNMMRITNVNEWGKLSIYLGNQSKGAQMIQKLKSEGLLEQDDSGVSLMSYDVIEKFENKPPFIKLVSIKDHVVTFDEKGKIKIFKSESEFEAAKNLYELVEQANYSNNETREQTLDIMGIKENRELVRETYFDSATGLMNRNGLAVGEKLLLEGKEMSIANFDADHFRASNEIKSREYGDAQIKIIAKNINRAVSELREAGYKAYGVRMGGEEFTIMSTAPQGILHKKMLEMSARSKQETLSTLSDVDKENMSGHIAKTKYSKDKNGVDKALSELGGISGSVIGIDGKVLDKGQKGNMKKSLMYADAAMEDLKKMHGRGNFNLDKKSSKDTSKEINEFKIHNVLSDVQKGNLDAEVKRLNGEVDAQFNGRLELTNSVINKVKTSKREAFGSELKRVLGSPDSTIADIGKVLEKYGAEVSLANKLQSEYVSNLRDHGTYTGANTMSSYQKEILRPEGRFEAKNSWELEVGKFKSINETLGHVGGDMYLTFVYQDVILSTAKDLGINIGTKEGDLVVAQKGANFRFCFSTEFIAKNPGIEAKFQAALNAKYKTKYQALISKLNKESGKDYQQERDAWLKENESTNPDSMIQQYNLYFNKS